MPPENRGISWPAEGGLAGDVDVVGRANEAEELAAWGSLPYSSLFYAANESSKHQYQV